MKFDSSRFAKLAGFGNKKTSLNESRSRTRTSTSRRNRKVISESRDMDWGNEEDDEAIYEMHDIDLEDDMMNDMGTDLDPGFDDMTRMSDGYETEDDWDDSGGFEDDYAYDAGYEDGDDWAEDEDDYAIYEMKEEDSEDMIDEGDDDDTINIDERELFNEVKKIKKRKIVESQLKTLIKDELESLVSEMKETKDNTSWMFGGKKPTRSKKGSITRSFKGVGFK